MVLDPTVQRAMDNASKGSSGRKKKGRRGSGRGDIKKRAAARDARAAEAAEPEAPSSEVAHPAPEAAQPAPAQPAPAQPAPQPAPAYKYDDSKLKRASKNARLKAIAYPMAFGVGGLCLFGGVTFGAPTWMAALGASIAASVTWKLIDSQIR